jgi:hypothetical protein
MVLSHGSIVPGTQRTRGNCTDFHSLFIALARARGIPARFIIGFPLGTGPSGQIPGYHCWAEFYSGGVWVPVDASEAWKNPSRHDYYFGHLEPAGSPSRWGAIWPLSRRNGVLCSTTSSIHMPNLTAHPSRKTRLRAVSRITTYRWANKSPRGSSGNHYDYRDSARARARSVSDCTLATILLTLG